MDDFQEFVDLSAEGMQNVARGFRALNQHVRSLAERVAMLEHENDELSSRVALLEITMRDEA